MWNLRGLAPESSRSVFLLAFVAALPALVTAACGPSNGGGAPAIYRIVFTLSNTPDDLDALKFEVTYDNGNFSGSGTTVSCDLVNDANTAEFNDDNIDKLTADIDASEEVLVEGDNIVGCNFVSTIQPTSNDFTVVVKTVSGDTENVDPGDVDVVVTSTELAE